MTLHQIVTNLMFTPNESRDFVICMAGVMTALFSISRWGHHA